MNELSDIRSPEHQTERGQELYDRILRQHSKPGASQLRMRQPRRPSSPADLYQSQLFWDEAALETGKQWSEKLDVQRQKDLYYFTDAARQRVYVASFVVVGPKEQLAEPKGDVKFYIRTMSAWGFTSEDAGIVLGIRNPLIANEVFRGALNIPGGETDERLTIMTKLILDLDGLYDDDRVIKQWLDTQRKELAGKSARELLVSGKFQALLQVRSLVRYEVRR